MRETAEKADRIFGYLNNHYHGYAVENCLQILDMLGILTPEQTKARTHVENYLERSVRTKASTLEVYIEPRERNFDTLLNYFIDVRRLARARRIKDKELKIVKETDKRIESIIRNYHIVIDLDQQTILHDCADWNRVLSTKKLCKHIGKLLLSIKKEKAEQILEKIYAEKETWQFKPYIV